MLDAPNKEWDKLKEALVECAKAAVTVDGLKVQHPASYFEFNRVEMAAVIALQSLLQTWVRPKGTHFIFGFGTDNQKTL